MHADLIIAYVDVETTGFSPKNDEIIELAVVVASVDPHSCQIKAIIGEYQSLNEPSRSIPYYVTKVNGLNDKMVSGHSIDIQAVEDLLANVDIIIAHNAKFDRSFLIKIIPCTTYIPWACSLSDIPWKKWMGEAPKKLAVLASNHGLAFKGNAHRAMADAQMGLQLLGCNSKDNKTYLRHIAESISKPWTHTDDQLLIQGVIGQLNLRTAAWTYGRSMSSILARLNRLGISDPLSLKGRLEAANVLAKLNKHQ